MLPYTAEYVSGSKQTVHAAEQVHLWIHNLPTAVRSPLGHKGN